MEGLFQMPLAHIHEVGVDFFCGRQVVDVAFREAKPVLGAGMHLKHMVSTIPVKLGP